MLVILGSATTLTAQISSDSLEQMIQSAVKTEVEAQLNWLYWLLGISITGLTILGLILWFWRIGKVVDKAIATKTDGIVERKLGEKVGVKPELIRSYFDKIGKLEGLYQTPIYVLNAKQAKRTEIENTLVQGGFKFSDGFNLAHFEANGIDANKYKVVLFDDEDGKLGEEKIIEIFEANKEVIPVFVCYTKKNWEQYNVYSKKIKLAKDIANIASYIESDLKSKIML